MSETPESQSAPEGGDIPHKRRIRYAGKNPRRFEDKYKERDGPRHAETIAKVISSGKTPAGTHRPIMVAEILEVLGPKPGLIAADCTLGYGGHAHEMLGLLLPGGHLLGLDADPVELSKTEARLRALGHGEEVFTAHRGNFAGLPQVVAGQGFKGVDLILADLGISSMQIDDPARGFSFKQAGPLDMRLNAGSGQTASLLLARITAGALAALLRENADEPRAEVLAQALAGKRFMTTTELASAVRSALPGVKVEEVDLTVRRVFQALRIAVNNEFSSLDALLRVIPKCLNPGGRVAILTFHSGEDRRVKKAFEAGLRDGSYAGISSEVARAGFAERTSNPRSTSAKLRWARKA